MKYVKIYNIPFVIITFLLASLDLWSQDYNVRIEGQILGYDGFSKLNYSFSDGNYFNNYEIGQPDSLGRFIILKSINSTKFFRFHYRNANEEDSFYECRLIVQPGENYSIVCESHEYEDYKTLYSPQIYSLKESITDGQNFFKLDYGQMYYNLFDNGTFGSLYRYEWDLQKPDALIESLHSRTQKQKALYTDLLNRGEINKEFYEIAKLNAEYFNVYRLVQTLQDTWGKPQKFGFEDTVIANKLIDVYLKVFELYPIENVKFDQIWISSDRYINAYLYYIQNTRNGQFSPRHKGEDEKASIEEIKHLIPKEVYKNYKLDVNLGQVAGLQLHSSNEARKFLEENPDIRQTFYGVFLENELIPRSEAFDSLAERKLLKDVIILDDNAPILSFQQLLDNIGNKPIFIEFWGTWCSPCRSQFQFKDSLKYFLEKNKIELVYVAIEYDNDRIKWKKLISAYNLTGYHLMSNDSFSSDFEKYSGKIYGIPAYMIIDSQGKIVETKAFYPSDGEKLYKQIKQKLMF